MDSVWNRISWKSAFSGKKTLEITGKLTSNFPSKTDMSSKHLQTFKAFHSLLPNGVQLSLLSSPPSTHSVMHSFTIYLTAIYWAPGCLGGAAEQKSLLPGAVWSNLGVKNKQSIIRVMTLGERGAEVWEPLTEGRAKLAWGDWRQFLHVSWDL